MDSHPTTADSTATRPAQPLSETERKKVAHWLSEAQADQRSSDAGVPTHCSNIIVQLCGLVGRLSGEEFGA